VEQVRRIVVECGVQAVVAHDNAVDHVQLPIDPAEMVQVVVVAHVPRHLLGGGAGEKMQVGIYDFHGGKVSSLVWDGQIYGLDNS